jgi:hypothetical protein
MPNNLNKKSGGNKKKKKDCDQTVNANVWWSQSKSGDKTKQGLWPDIVKIFYILNSGNKYQTETVTHLSLLADDGNVVVQLDVVEETL